ncbi:MAG: hypothetical protein MN733_27960, partial [Nitrososphaera sp.]|nr:hypothetical protein [Nitrososphaera sp.]
LPLDRLAGLCVVAGTEPGAEFLLIRPGLSEAQSNHAFFVLRSDGSSRWPVSARFFYDRSVL